jgi:hypothetical protein
LSFRWTTSGKVVAGDFCTAQGLILQFGESGAALTTLVRLLQRSLFYFFLMNYIKAITVHTFVAIFWRKGVHARGVAFGTVALIWLFVILWAAIGGATHRNPSAPYVAPNPVCY